jgi:hypothetical protein
MGSGERHHAIL